MIIRMENESNSPLLLIMHPGSLGVALVHCQHHAVVGRNGERSIIADG